MAQSFFVNLSSYYGNVLPEVEIYDPDRDKVAIKILNRHLQVEPIEGIKTGDIVRIFENPYINDGKYVWNGTKVVPLCFRIDDYGSIPSSFLVGTRSHYKPNHWEDVIANNGYFYPTITLRTQVVTSLKFYGPDEGVGNELRGSFTYLGETYDVIIVDSQHRGRVMDPSTFNVRHICQQIKNRYLPFDFSYEDPRLTREYICFYTNVIFYDDDGSNGKDGVKKTDQQRIQDIQLDRLIMEFDRCEEQLIETPTSKKRRSPDSISSFDFAEYQGLTTSEMIKRYDDEGVCKLPRIEGEKPRAARETANKITIPIRNLPHQDIPIENQISTYIMVNSIEIGRGDLILITDKNVPTAGYIWSGIGPISFHYKYERTILPSSMILEEISLLNKHYWLPYFSTPHFMPPLNVRQELAAGVTYCEETTNIFSYYTFRGVRTKVRFSNYKSTDSKEKVPIDQIIQRVRNAVADITSPIFIAKDSPTHEEYMLIRPEDDHVDENFDLDFEALCDGEDFI